MPCFHCCKHTWVKLFGHVLFFNLMTCEITSKALSDKNAILLNTPTFYVLWMNFCGRIFLGSITPKTPETDTRDTPEKKLARKFIQST